ncbi:hypothetical protein J4Q44_G00019980 [Coregonus suidteri]|uniref:Uncharacterized protein n=1 Tax=Coregonus suidteri TaxID=861788 RepID=A0AAN8M8Y0_9TELE
MLFTPKTISGITPAARLTQKKNSRTGKEQSKKGSKILKTSTNLKKHSCFTLHQDHIVIGHRTVSPPMIAL